MINYLTDAKGKTKAVLIPISQWRQIEKELSHSKALAKLKNELSTAWKESKQLQTGEIENQTLGEFLNEL